MKSSMKFFKYILAAALAVGVLSSCEEETTGAGDATVGFGSATYSFSEAAGMVRVPVTVAGEPVHAPATFDVTATSVSGEDMSELVLFTQISDFKYQGDPENQVYVEFQILCDDDVINDASRFFTLTITNADGIEILPGQETTTVEIRDNDNNPYERLWGNWTLTGTSVSDGSTMSFSVNISGGFTDEEIAENADKVLVCWGFNGYQEDVTGQIEPGHQPVWYIDYDAATSGLSIQVGTMLANIFSFSIPDVTASTYELMTASLYVPDENSGFDSHTQIDGTWSEDMNTITFDPDYGLCAVIYADGNYTGYYWTGVNNIVMTRN